MDGEILRSGYGRWREGEDSVLGKCGDEGGRIGDWVMVVGDLGEFEGGRALRIALCLGSCSASTVLPETG